jgi:IclR family transcriptional regulator, acetate operon repressor
MKLKRPTIVKSADRALDVLEHVAQSPALVSFSQLMTELSIPRSSLSHLLNNLLARGYLRQEPATGAYQLGPRLRELAERLPKPSMGALVTPLLHRLTESTNETSGCYRRVDDEVEVIASVTASQALAYTMKVGERAPPYAVSAGKIALAQMSVGEFEAYLGRVHFEKFTPNTLTSKDSLRREIEAARGDGFAYVREEFTVGITGIAMAVIAGGDFVGALNLAVPTARFTEDKHPLFKRELRAACVAVAEALAPNLPIASKARSRA